MLNLKDVFAKVFVINLKSRPDRLQAFFETIDAVGWPFKRPEVWTAVPASSGQVPCPPGFTEGGGAFGCRQSHVGILQHCLMEEVTSVLILEDDATVMSSFCEDAGAFMELVPDDWQGIMLGGQHHREPIALQSGLVRVTYAQRTHAYACRGDYLRGLYGRWAMASVHIDWLMEDWQEHYRIYAPERWLIGQARSLSDICGRSNAATFWNSVYREMPVVFLNVPREVMEPLCDRFGFHSGYTRNSDHVDVGLVEAFESLNSSGSYLKLEEWISMIQYECGQTEHLICAIWHPEASKRQIELATRSPVIEICADTLDAAVIQVQDLLPTLRSITPAIVNAVALVNCPHEVIHMMRRHRFHFGNWRDQETDIDKGLLNIYDDVQQSTEDRHARLREWFEVLNSEADRFGGIVSVWHPQACRDDFEAIGLTVVEIAANDIGGVLNQWRLSRRELALT